MVSYTKNIEYINIANTQKISVTPVAEPKCRSCNTAMEWLPVALGWVYLRIAIDSFVDVLLHSVSMLKSRPVPRTSHQAFPSK